MNLIRMNIYRLWRTKSLYILTLITILMVSFAILDQESCSSDTQEEECEENETVGMTIGILKDDSASMLTVEIIGSGVVLIFTSIFAVLFSNAERNGGYLKNLNSCVAVKSQIFLAKIVPVTLFSLLNLCVIPLIALIAGRNGTDIFTYKFGVYMLLQWLIHTAFGVFILMIMEFTRSLVAGILSGIFVGMGVLIIALSFIETSILHINNIFSTHTLVYAAKTLSLENITTNLLSMFIISIVGLVLYTWIGSMIFCKRDIY